MNQQLSQMKGYDTDKSEGYLNNYEKIFSALCGSKVYLLELGIFKCGSLYLWRDYFPSGNIAGLDCEKVSIEDPTNRIKIYQGLQQDTVLLDKIRKECAPNGFDIIIDDASHIAEFTKMSFWHLFNNHLKKGGYYIIEDWGTGYWESWPDGKRYNGDNHLAGMVGLIKELVDEAGFADITHSSRGNIKPFRESKFEYIQLSCGQAIIQKK